MKLIITDIKDFNIPVTGKYKVISPKSEIHHCIGCFGCWIKTPGRCVIKDGYENTGIDLSKCDELIIISECKYGSVSSFVKTVQDRAISYIHPDFEIRKGEMHHKRRYDNIINLTAYFYGDNITDKEKDTAIKHMSANVDNYDGILGEVQFFNSIEVLSEVTI